MKTGLSLISSPVVDVGRDGEPRCRPSMASLLGEPWRDIRAGPRLGYGLLLTRCGAASPRPSVTRLLGEQCERQPARGRACARDEHRKSESTTTQCLLSRPKQRP